MANGETVVGLIDTWGGIPAVCEKDIGPLVELATWASRSYYLVLVPLRRLRQSGLVAAVKS